MARVLQLVVRYAPTSPAAALRKFLCKLAIPIPWSFSSGNARRSPCQPRSRRHRSFGSILGGAATALLPVLACFFGGGTLKWDEGIVIASLGLSSCSCDRPRRSLGIILNCLFVIFIGLGCACVSAGALVLFSGVANRSYQRFCDYAAEHPFGAAMDQRNLSR